MRHQIRQEQELELSIKDSEELRAIKVTGKSCLLTSIRLQLKPRIRDTSIGVTSSMQRFW